MRQLILFRHSKAVTSAGAGDHARALSHRGLAEAAAAGLALIERLRPDFALVSDARRTRETFDQLIEAAGRDIPHRFDRALYGATPEEILAVTAGAPPKTRRLLVIGHNPGLGELARSLTRSGDARGRRDLAGRFPTSAFAVIGLDGTGWRQNEEPGTLDAFVTMDSAGSSD